MEILLLGVLWWLARGKKADTSTREAPDPNFYTPPQRPPTPPKQEPAGGGARTPLQTPGVLGRGAIGRGPAQAGKAQQSRDPIGDKRVFSAPNGDYVLENSDGERQRYNRAGEPIGQPYRVQAAAPLMR